MADFLNQIFHPSVPIEKSIQAIQLNRNFKSIYGQDNKYHDLFQSQINSYLSVPAKRVHAFLLIQEYLLEMPKDLLGDSLKNWATFCASYIEGSTWNGKDVALQLLDKLLKVGHSDDSSRRKLSLHVVSSIVEYICRSNLIMTKCSPSLVYQVLLTCVTKYPGSCGSKKNLINNFIVKNIHNFTDGYEVLISLLANIHYCPVPGQSNLTLKNSWFDHLCSLLVNLNAILNRIKTWGIGFNDLSLTQKKFTQLLNTHEKENFNGRIRLEQNFRALSMTICKMLQDTATLGITIPVSSILQLIFRPFSVKLGALYSMDPCLSLTVLSIQLDSLKILEQLIITCKTTLVPYSRFFYQGVTGILENSVAVNECANGTTLPTASQSHFSKMCIFDIKNYCYKIIAKWFSVNGPNMYIDKNSGDCLFKHFMMDMKLGEKNIELRNIKKDKSLTKMSGNSLSIPFIKDKLSSLHFNCLKASNSFVTNCSINLSPEQLNFFATFIVEEVLSLYKYSLSSAVLYEDSRTRKELLSLMVMLCLENEIIPLSIGLTLLQNALNFDSSSQIREFCFESLKAFDGTINPTRVLQISETTRNNPFYSNDVRSNDSIHQIESASEDNLGDKEASNQRENEKDTDETIDRIDKNESSNTVKMQNDKNETVVDNCATKVNEVEVNVITIQEVDEELYVKGKNDSTENDDCIVYDPDDDEDVKPIKIDRDDDLEIVSIKSNASFKRENIEHDANESLNKKPKVIQEDSQSQSSNRSLTIIEPSSNNDEPDCNTCEDLITLIKDFIAD